MSEYRIEKDSLGEMKVPNTALWGAQTQRAVENFPISNLRFPRAFIAAMGLIKRSAAETNVELELLPNDVAKDVIAAANEVIDGKHDAHFVLDIFQTGSGTSSNMNANEVIANRAIQIRGGSIGAKGVHPNDHVNLGQSSNDVIPTAMQVAACVQIKEDLLPSLATLQKSLEKKAREFDGIVKSGRTHLMDATPVRLGQEFSGFAAQVALGAKRVQHALDDMAELPLGGTAVGTGINTHERFAGLTVGRIAKASGVAFRKADNHFERQATRDTVVFAHGALNTLAVSFTKIANDLRLLASGPSAGIAEITLPSIQPGSSIMPGKVNPVIPEAVTMVAAQVMGNHTTITVGGTGSYFELNVMMPVMTHSLLQSVSLLAAAARVLAEKCVDGITANQERCTELLEKNPSLATALAPRIGYDLAASIAKESFKQKRTAREVAYEMSGLPRAEVDEIMDAKVMTEPGIPGGVMMPGGGG
jgi:fumarate hydratase, class II